MSCEPTVTEIEFNFGSLRDAHPDVQYPIAFANGFMAGFRAKVVALVWQWGDAAADFWRGYDAGRVLRLCEDMDGDLPDYIVGIDGSQRVASTTSWFKVRDLWR